MLDSEDWGSGLLCAGVWPDRIPSALLCTEDSCFSSVQRDGQVLLYCLNTLSLYGKRSELHNTYKSFGISSSAKSLVVNKILILFVLMKLFTFKVIIFCWPPTYTAQLRSWQPEFDSRLEVLC